MKKNYKKHQNLKSRYRKRYYEGVKSISSKKFKKLLRELSEEFATRRLIEKKQKAYYDILIDRVTSIYKNATLYEKKASLLDEIITFKIGETTVRGSKIRANKLRCTSW